MSIDLPPLAEGLRLAAPPAPEADADLLDRYARGRDEAAFHALVARHGPMVWRVCRRVLGNDHAAEDAFQATFRVLARRAGGIRRPAALAGWLYGVALRVARKARGACLARRLRQRPAGEAAPPGECSDVLARVTARELLLALDEEVERLRGACKLLVVLCCLEGLSQEEAARQLGWTPGSVKGRLERGRRRLHHRLARRGLSLTGVLAASEVSRASAALPPALAVSAADRAPAQKRAGGTVGSRLSVCLALAAALTLAAGAGLLAVSGQTVWSLVGGK
jgi:RNA polymerase sigma factor (sigma-70 family)